MAYSMEEHRHRLAIWAASRAASRGIRGLTTRVWKELLEGRGIGARFDFSCLPSRNFDGWHEKLCKSIVRAAGARKSPLTLSHGHSAKFLNVYLKVRFVCGENRDDRTVGLIHPPIDSLLLGELAKNNWKGAGAEWRKFAQIRWSNFSADDYRNLINLLRRHLGGEPFWKIECFWPGHQ